jgi:DGQHR domain-containing protein
MLLDSKAAREKILSMTNPDDKKVASLLLDLDFEMLDSNTEIKTFGTNNVIGEIDLLFLDSDYLFVIEVSRQSEKEKISTFFSKWSEPVNEDQIIKKYNLSSRKIFHIYVHFGSSSKSSVEINRLDSKIRNKIIYSDDFNYFQSSCNKIGKWARSDLLDFIDYRSGNEFEKAGAIQYYIGDTPIFCLVQRVDKLLRACYVFRRRTSGGYQRALNAGRISQIRENIQNAEGLIFPNSILINTEKILIQRPISKEECPKSIEVDFPLNYCSCRIIDGQHRLLGFSQLPPEDLKKHFLPVIALQGYDQLKEIRTFIDINSKQQKINKNLILALISSFDWDKTANLTEYNQKIAVDVSSQLDNSFLKNTVYVGSTDEKPGTKISLTTLVDSMIKNRIILGDFESTWLRIKQTFAIISGLKKYQWLHDKSYFKTNSGIRVLFRLVQLYDRNALAGRISMKESEFFDDVDKILDVTKINELKKFTGTFRGALDATAYLIQELKNSSAKYRKMESNLRLLR